MTSTSPEELSTARPPWPYCGHGAGADDGIGCRGRSLPEAPACLAHADETARTAYFALLEPGAAIDHRHTRLTGALMANLLEALRGSEHPGPRFGDANFAGATFIGDVDFTGASFTSDATFSKATFTGTAHFDAADFVRGAYFIEVRFSGSAYFSEARFSSDATFDGATFSDFTLFNGVRFEAAQRLGPILCDGALSLERVHCAAPVTIEVAATRISLRRTRWGSTAALRFRYAQVDLSGALLEYPLTLTAEAFPFTRRDGSTLPELPLANSLYDPRVRVLSTSGVDAAHLSLTDVDLSPCRFAGTIHLDQLRMEGHCTFAESPFTRRGLLRWTRRRTLAEEHHWRAARGPTGNSWTAAPPEQRVLGPGALAPVYRQLRKAFEDGKNEPDAADFYYGEMEMRRHDLTRAAGERFLLWLYWAVSGYGLRLLRALGCLLGCMAVSMFFLVLFGLPADTPKQQTTGRQVPVGREITLTTDTPDPTNPTGPILDRVSEERVEDALHIVLNSVLFRSSEKDLTTTGTYIEMASRFTEPVLLGLAVLTVRNRVKR